MSDKREIEDLSVEELKQLLYTKRRVKRQNRLRRLKAEGRVVEIDKSPDDDAQRSETRAETTLESEEPDIESLAAGSPDSVSVTPGDESDEYSADVIIEFDRASQPTEEEKEGYSFLNWRPFANRFLLIVEIVAVVGLLILAYTIWQTTRELNQEIAVVQQAASDSLALPTPKATPVIGVAVLPSGHKPPLNGRPPEPGEAGDIPAHLLPILDAYIPPPAPTPGPEQARRIQIPVIDLDKPIVQGDSWEELKKGVGQHVGTSLPGQLGNIVLSAHNDIYGEIFRNLDQLGPGDEIIISTERQVYIYVVRDLQVVDPTDVWVMAPTEHASSTLISCYPYLVNNKRIVIFADLASPNPLS
ncbi:MAG TPA: class D sortase [candidate division Zixibacteria bacterium]|nr:class D sortase [candidate division Zixibacteria bacterium]